MMSEDRKGREEEARLGKKGGGGEDGGKGRGYRGGNKVRRKERREGE